MSTLSLRELRNNLGAVVREVALTHHPPPAGVKKLVGRRSDWRIRIGEYRIVYEIDDATKTVTALGVAHRRDASVARTQ